eukprot:scaffold49424_cov61-Phaeocystis_antarctica.AAC.4
MDAGSVRTHEPRRHMYRERQPPPELTAGPSGWATSRMQSCRRAVSAAEVALAMCSCSALSRSGALCHAPRCSDGRLTARPRSSCSKREERSEATRRRQQSSCAPSRSCSGGARFVLAGPPTGGGAHAEASKAVRSCRTEKRSVRRHCSASSSNPCQLRPSALSIVARVRKSSYSCCTH